MKQFYPNTDISAIGSFLAECHFKTVGNTRFPIDPEIIATKFFGLNIYPEKQLSSVGVRSGIDTSQSVIFIDFDTYMRDDLQHLSHQGIAHELGHVLFDSPTLRRMTSSSVESSFQLHSMVMQQEPGIEARANILAGAFLVPREYLVLEIAKALTKNHERIVDLGLDLTMSQVLNSLASSRLSRHFCVSDHVLSWRMTDENIYAILKTTPESKLSELNIKHVTQLAGMPYKPRPLSDSLKSLIPEDLLNFNQRTTR